MTTQIKKCSKCKREFPLTSYYFHKGGGKTGFKSDCKECRGYSFGETKKSNKINLSWSNEDIEFMRLNYSSMDNIEIAKILNKTQEAVNSKARYLHLFKESWWSEEEFELLKRYYPSMTTDKFQQQYMSNRTLSSIKKKAMELSISKSDEILLSVRSSNLGGYFSSGEGSLHWNGCSTLRIMARNRLSKWIDDIKEKYNHQCVLTNDTDNLIVHHKTSFKSIFYDVLDTFIIEYNLPIYETVEEYYKNNLTDILNKFMDEIVIRHDLETGVLIRKDLHDLFHHFYGTRNIDENDFNEFVRRFYNKEFELTKGVV